MTTTDTSRGRHRLATGGMRRADRESRPPGAASSPRPVRQPALLPRSAAVISATVGAVLAMGVDQQVFAPTPRPHPTSPAPALEPVIPVQRDGRPARIDPVPAGLTGKVIAGAHAAGSAPVRALDAVAATQPPRGVTATDLFAT